MPAGPKDVHRVFHEFADITSMHGVPRIINARSVPARIFWSIICLAAFGMFLWQSAILLQLYYSYPKKVNVEIVQRPVQFPAVSVCNSDPLDLLVMDRLIRWAQGSNFTESNHTDTEDKLEQIVKQYEVFFERTNAFYMLYAQTSKHAKFTEDNIILDISSRLGLTANLGMRLSKMAGIQLTDFIVSCRFMDDKCNVSTSFVQIFDPYFFNCYTFQPETILPSRRTHLQGVEYGLSLLLFTGSSGHMEKDVDREFEDLIIPGMQEPDVALASGKGARVVVHSPHTLPHPTAEGFDIPPTFSVEIGVKARENVRIRHPHGNCTDESANNSTFHYTLIQCQHECIQRRIMKICGCIDNRIPQPDDVGDLQNCFKLPPVPEECIYGMTMPPFCNAIMDRWLAKINCRKAVYKNMTIRDNTAMDSCMCYPPCNDIVYDTLYSLSTLPEDTQQHSAFYSVIEKFLSEDFSQPRMQHLKHKYGDKYEEKMGKQISRLNVHIADSNIIKTTEAPDYEAIRLVSDIGGQLGLWIGISVMTLFEVLQLFADVLRYQYRPARTVRPGPASATPGTQRRDAEEVQQL